MTRYLGKSLILRQFPRMNIPNFCSFSRRQKGHIASYVTLFTTQKIEKKTSKLGIFFAGNRLRLLIGFNTNNRNSDSDEHSLHIAATLAGKLTASPDLGLRASQGGRCRQSKLPKPLISMRSPWAMASAICPRIPFSANSTSLN